MQKILLATLGFIGMVGFLSFLEDVRKAEIRKKKKNLRKEQIKERQYITIA